MDCLEGRRLLSTTITGSVTLDESLGLQSGGTAVSGEDNNDNDVALSVLQSDAATFYNRLFGAGGLGLSTSFATQTGVARSAAGFITVSSPGTITSLGFSKADGTALPVLGGADPGVASGLSAVDGGAISLFADSVLGSRVVIGKDADGDIVSALFMDPNATLTSARVWTVQLEAILNPDATDFDDPVTLGGLGVSAGVSTTFDFNTLPSGQNLFGMLGDPTTGLIVIGKTPVLSADGTYTNTSNTINTSKGGGGTTIGVNNQMFDPGEGAYFTFVKNPDPNFLGVALDANEADDADNMVYSGGTLEVNSGFLNVVQTQGGGAKTLRLSAFNVSGNPQGRDLITASRSSVNITQVQVNGTTVFTGSAATVNVTIAAGDTVSWTTAGLHDQVLVEGVAGKWDIGGFGTTQPSTEFAPLTGIRFEDDGPLVAGTDPDAPPLTVDETTLGDGDTFDAGDLEATAFDASFGQDGTGTTTFAYALSTPGGDSGLVDTLSGQSVILSLTAGGVVEGRTETSGLLVFSVTLGADGVTTFTQQRAVVHPTTDPDESIILVATNLVQVTATTTDADGDETTAVVNVTGNLVFKDDGPTITASAIGAPTLTVDESDFATNSAGAFSVQFTPVFGADGPGTTPVSYALSTPGGASGLTDTASGQSVVLSLTAGGVVEGRTATSGLLVFSVSVDSSGQVTLDQSRSIVHADATDDDDSRTLAAANLVVLTATATDGDTDTDSDPLNIGQLLVFADDGPAIGPIDNSIVDLAIGATVTKSLNGAVGADPNASPYTIDSFTASLTVNGILLNGVLSGNSTVVTYFGDTNGSGTFGDAGDTAFYRLTLSQAGAGAYTFDVLVEPPPAEVAFNFEELPSGQNLFGMIGDPTTGLIVIGKAPVLAADGTYTNTSNTINTSKGGGGTTIGVNNQMFDPGEGAYFTFVKNPDANFLSNNLDSNEADDADNMLYTGGTLEVDSGFLQVVQKQGGGAQTMRLSAFNITGSPQGRDLITATRTPVNITEVKVNGVVVFTGSAATVNVNIAAGDTVSWKTDGLHDQVLVEGVAGKWDIGGFGTTQAAPTPDQVLEFVVKVTDGDGDTNTDGFYIGIDGTGPLFDDDIVTFPTSTGSMFGSDDSDDEGPGELLE